MFLQLHMCFFYRRFPRILPSSMSFFSVRSKRQQEERGRNFLKARIDFQRSRETLFLLYSSILKRTNLIVRFIKAKLNTCMYIKTKFSLQFSRWISSWVYLSRYYYAQVDFSSRYILIANCKCFSYKFLMQIIIEIIFNIPYGWQQVNDSWYILQNHFWNFLSFLFPIAGYYRQLSKCRDCRVPWIWIRAD